jgi:L-ascorbate metabolism protein UlaG (beta-lactamase superfamily)
LGKLSQKELTTEQLEEIGDVDILMVPVGGGESIVSKDALKIMEQIEPKLVIPMYYKVSGLKEKLEDVSDFLKSLGIKALPAIDKLVIKKKELSEEEAKIIVLNN